MKPKLTYVRWRSLKKLERFEGKPFTAEEADVHGAALFSLEKCGWVERTFRSAELGRLPFSIIQTQGHYWKITEAGREATDALPETPPRRY
jgi:hypothetical protein